MKKTILIIGLFLAAVSSNVLGDGHLAEEQSKGAFTTLMVAAKDTDRYLKSVKSNPALYEAIGADAGGYCRTVSGQDYAGQLMMWTAFPNVTAALVASSKYDPSNVPRAMANMREFKYGATWAPLKGFPRLDPGYERAMRIKVSPANVPALVAALTKLEKEIQEAGHDTFINGLFVAIGGGTQEAGTLYLKSITSDEKTHGAVIDDYLSGAPWVNTYLQASSLIDEVVNDQFEVCEQFYTAE
ncbi:MAG TPA: hypothetical protein EYQ44_06215 [Porticoccaceae bacterium]|nr:hypothetical protein [Porticoccaceae bacterium]HIK79488.1 hypothetical protein [Porticoccaceae bacterium]